MLHHSIELPNGLIAVSHVTYENYKNCDRVCLVTGEGLVVKSYDGSERVEIEQLCDPNFLSADVLGNILAVDKHNSTLVVLSLNILVD